MIDCGTGYPEITPLANGESEYVAKKFDSCWLCRYPRAHEVRHDNGPEFAGFGFQQLLHSYNIKSIPTAVKNLEENAIVERLHLIMGDMFRIITFEGKH